MVEILMAAYTHYRRDPRVRREAEALIEAGYRVTFLSRRQPGGARRESLCGVEVVNLPGLRNKRTSILGYVLDYAVFFALISAHLLVHPRRYRLIHINNMPDFLVFAAWLPRLLGRPVIHDVHDLMPELYVEKFPGANEHWLVRTLKVQERWAGGFASAVLTVEERLRDILVARGTPRGKIHVLMNLPDDRIFVPRPAQAPKGPSAPFVVVYHGTLARRLGLDIAIEAIAIARPAIPRLQLRIIGAGEERTRLMALRERLGLQDSVVFSDGFVPVEGIPGLLHDADLGVVPLRISSGTDVMLPTKLLEYVLLGIPCVVPRTGTISRYFDDEMVRFFEAENVESLSAAFVELYRDADKRARLAQQATLRFGARYGWREHRKIYTSLVAELLANGRAMPATERSGGVAE